ncbi:nucleotide disphospho-sugar-binding domain-containing protein [Micromonospora arborensis]|uniref:glycosyltransferase n=1 Tax=Micromonospora arborensis TaxID=2116518 RepID=UPI0033EFE93F
MAKVVVGATPFQGHVSPILTVATDLVRRGHEVVVYTGSRFEERALAIGARFQALPPEADLDVLVVAATVRDDGPDLVRQALTDVPDNVRLAGFVPFDRLLPHADALVTNGGYGGVQTALHYGVPLVVAGASEDKPEVAARVEWSGTGVNLRTSTPGTTELRAAVQAVLHDPGYRSQAGIMAKEIGQHDPFDAIAEIVDASGGSR